MEALIIAESEVFLARVRAARVAELESLEKERKHEGRSRIDGEIKDRTEAPRTRHPAEYYLSNEHSKAIITATISAFARGDLRKVTKILNRMTAVLRLDIKCLKAKQSGKPDTMIRARKAALLADAEREALARLPAHEAPHRMLQELISLERYERRALSRRRRAIRRFDALRSKEYSSSVASTADAGELPKRRRASTNEALQG